MAQRLCAERRCAEERMREVRAVISADIRREYEAYLKDAEALRVQSAKALGIANADAYLLIAVPGLRRRITRLPRRRLKKFREHLAGLIAEASAERGGGSAGRAQAHPAPERALTSAEMSDVVGKGCAHCRGYCCVGGADFHAYLSVERIARYMAANSDLSPEDVLTAYLSHVGTHTFRNSCVYHGSAGCTLPRDMRADICNQFYCSGLIELMSGAPDQGPVRAFYTSRSADTIKGSFVDIRDVRVVRRKRRPVAADARRSPPVRTD